MLLILTLLPLNWIDTVSAASNKALGNEETGSVSVEYLNEERTEAEITYRHKKQELSLQDGAENPVTWCMLMVPIR